MAQVEFKDLFVYRITKHYSTYIFSVISHKFRIRQTAAKLFLLKLNSILNYCTGYSYISSEIKDGCGEN